MSYAEDGKLPIIYVRGYAGNTSEINSAVDDPFYGFSVGAVHVRSDGRGNPLFYQFESPMLRLMSDHNYTVPVYGDQAQYLREAETGTVTAASIWIFRFYDQAATTFGTDHVDYTIESAAERLFEFIETVLEKTGAPKVFLVAHSMGGLICRAAIQRTIPETLHSRNDFHGKLDSAAASRYVARFFTYATPHGGIHFGIGNGLLEGLRDTTKFFGADIFGPGRMYEYLTPGIDRGERVPPDFDPTVMPDSGFPVGQIFCLIGSDPEDYDAAAGLSAAVVGPRSDGLVQIENAAVRNAHRAVIHRSHSGRYGIVNSEAGYQNLQRFLFGDLEVSVELIGFTVGKNSDSNVVFQMDIMLAIRGLPILVHEQSVAHHCPVLIERPAKSDTLDTPRPLLTTFLSSAAQRPMDNGQQVNKLRHALNFRLLSIRESDGRFQERDHLEQTPDWSDSLIVDVEPAANDKIPRAWAAWKSQVPPAAREWSPRKDDELTDRAPKEPLLWVGEISVPDVAKRLLGDSARIRLTVTPRSLQTPDDRSSDGSIIPRATSRVGALSLFKRLVGLAFLM